MEMMLQRLLMLDACMLPKHICDLVSAITGQADKQMCELLLYLFCILVISTQINAFSGYIHKLLVIIFGKVLNGNLVNGLCQIQHLKQDKLPINLVIENPHLTITSLASFSAGLTVEALAR